MKTVSGHVEEYMKRRPFLSKYLRSGIINHRALARRVRPGIEQVIGERISLESIAISLQRLANQLQVDLQPIGTLKGIHIISKLHLLTCRPDALQHFLQTSESEHIIAVTSDTENTILLLRELPPEASLSKLSSVNFSVTKNLTGLKVELVEARHREKVGSIIYPLNVLAQNNIPVVLNCSTEDSQLIVVEEEYVDKAVKLLRTSLAK